MALNPVRTLTILVLCLLCLDMVPAHAVRCGNRLVSAGELQLTVWQKCGEPAVTDWYVTYCWLLGYDF
jgi:hypothetical protein